MAGVDCIDLGLLPTPMIHHAKRRLRAAGCAVVTTSHHRSDLNGLSWLIGDRPATPEQVACLREGAKQPVIARAERPQTVPRTLDVSFDYVAWLQETWCDSLRAQQHIVIDPMHGCWSGRARRYLHAIFPECLISVVQDSHTPESDEDCPECCPQGHLDRLCEAVYRERAHLGIALLGDRVALVDGQSIPLTCEETAWVLMQSLGSELEGKRFVYDIEASDRLAEAARELGAEPLAERSLPQCIHARMLESNARLGVQIDGRYYFSELGGSDDAFYTACRVIAYLARSGKTLGEIRRRCPKIFMTPDLCLPLAGEAQQQALHQIREVWAQFPQTVLDGVRVDLPSGWALAHSRNGDSALTFRFESSDWTGLDDLVRMFCNGLSGVGEELWNCYETAMGVEQRESGR